MFNLKRKSKLKDDKKTSGLDRRGFFKRLAGTSVGALVGTALPTKVHAFGCFIPSFDEALEMVVQEVFDYFSGDYLDALRDYMGDFADFIGENNTESNANITAGLTKLGDAKNQNEVTLAEEELKRATEPAPHDCVSRALGESYKELSEASILSQKKIVSEYIDANNKPELKPNYQQIKQNRNRIKHIIDEGRVDTIEGANFYSERGYTDVAIANEFLRSIMGNTSIVPEHSKSIASARSKSINGLRYIAAKDAHNATVNLVYDALVSVLVRRVPSIKVQDFLSANSEDDVKNIISRKGYSNGISLVDIEQLEIDRTHFNEVWRQRVRREYADSTPMMEELNKLQVFNNSLDNATKKIAERNNQLNSVKQLLLMKIKDANG
jgi:hypothetical protein